MALFDSLFKKSTKQLIIQKFYSTYPEKPYVAEDRPIEWISRAEILPKQCLVDRSMMKRYPNGLLPGHVYMLYWLKKYTNKSIPAYFEYKYGIDFEKEKFFLKQHGYLDAMDKPTDTGEKVIQKYYEVIKNHTPPKPDRSIGVKAPPMHEDCKCSIAAYEDEEEYEKWLDFLAKGGSTAQWEKMKKKKR